MSNENDIEKLKRALKPRAHVEEQRAPKPNGSRPIWELVVEDMQARDAIGRERYGTPLQSYNGRDALVDAYQEALDLVVYLRQAIEERSIGDPGALARRLYETEGESWEQVPEISRRLMTAMCAALGGIASTVPALPHRAALAAEVERLRAREQELLDSNSRLVERLRDADWYQAVREFFVIADQPRPERVGVPPEAELRLGLELVAEETAELLGSALGKPSPHDLDAWEAWNRLEQVATEYVRKAPVRVNMPDLTDAIGDSIYVLLGLAIRLGVDIRSVFELIHAANMKKQGGPVDPVTGKKLKPPGWAPPDVRGELERQGWRCSTCNGTRRVSHRVDGLPDPLTLGCPSCGVPEDPKP